MLNTDHLIGSCLDETFLDALDVADLRRLLKFINLVMVVNFMRSEDALANHSGLALCNSDVLFLNCLPFALARGICL